MPSSEARGLTRDFRWHKKAKNLAQAIRASALRPQYITGRRESIAFVIVAPQFTRAAFEVIMIGQLVKYLRESAQSCVDLARGCQDSLMSQSLEVLATDLMAKAKELDDLNMD